MFEVLDKGAEGEGGWQEIATFDMARGDAKGKRNRTNRGMANRQSWNGNLWAHPSIYDANANVRGIAKQVEELSLSLALSLSVSLSGSDCN